MELEFKLIPIPAELLEEAGIDENTVMECSVCEGNLIISKADTTDFVCDEDCDNCPFYDIDCDGDCSSCPCSETCDESEDERNE